MGARRAVLRRFGRTLTRRAGATRGGAARGGATRGDAELVVTRRRLVAGALVVAVLAIAVAGYLFLARTPTPTVAAGAPRFVDETASSGLEHRYDGGSTFAVGGGVAVFDCSGDGRPELFIAGGEEPAALFRNDGTLGGPLRFARIEDPVTD